MFKLLDSSDGVRAFWSECFFIEYVKDDYRVHRYVPDLLVERTDGAIDLVEVTGTHLLDEKRFKIPAAEQWCADHDINFVIVTEKGR